MTSARAALLLTSVPHSPSPSLSQKLASRKMTPIAFHYSRILSRTWSSIAV
jgi:hypothetical protein